VSPFVVLGGSTVTNTGPSVLNGDLGVAPGTALVGFGLPAVVNGATHDNDGVANIAKADLVTAYNVAAGQPVAPADDLTGQDLGNKRLVAGAYRFTSSAQLTGALTLDAQGDPNAQFVFEIGTSLTTASASSVVMVNGGNPCNVYWQVGSSATLGTGSHLVGSVLAQTAITANNAATIQGRLLARTASVTLNHNTITRAVCAASTPSTTRPKTTRTTVPRTTTSTQPGGANSAVPGSPVATPAAGPGTPGSGTPGTPGTSGTPGTPGSETPPHLPTTE
jgi:hypothetical protein